MALRRHRPTTQFSKGELVPTIKRRLEMKSKVQSALFVENLESKRMLTAIVDTDSNEDFKRHHRQF